MSTFVTMRSNIADQLNRSDLNTQINTAINRAIRYYYNLRRFWFNETTGTFTTIASQESYGTADGIPSDIAEIDLARITLTSTNIPGLIPRTIQWIEQMNRGATTGTPYDYGWYQGKMYFYPIPNSAYTITLFYKKSYSDLSNDSDSNDYTSLAEDLIEARALSWVYANILKDPENAQIQQTREAQELVALDKRSYEMLSIGKIRPTQF